MRALELRVPPPALFVICALAMAALAGFSLPPLEMSLRLSAALALGLTGGVVALTGIATFRQHKTTVNPLAPYRASSLVTTGIYRYSRNPMYLGWLLVLLGWAVYLGNWMSAAPLPVFVAWITRFQIIPEERALLDLFGTDFLAYRQSVRRWL